MLRAWFLHRLGQRPRRQGRTQRASRSRSLVTEMESLEGRALFDGDQCGRLDDRAGVTHHALYAIGAKDNVEVSVDGGSFTNLGFYAKQVSAGLDVFNKPEVYAIGADNAVWVKDGSSPWVSLGGYAKEISATVENTIYAIGTDDNIYLSHGSPGLGWFNTGLKARQISAGADGGNPEVYAIGFDNHVYAGNGSGGPGGFANWGGYAKQIAATIDSTVYAIGADNAVYKDSGSGSGSGWVSLGGYAKQISAGIDGTFGPFVLAIGLNDGLWSNHGLGWVSLGGYVTEVSGPAISSFGVSLPADLAYAVGKGHGGLLHAGTSFTSLGGYIQTSSGSASNNTNTWAPAARDISAVSWLGPFFLKHNAVYAIAPNDSVEVSFARRQLHQPGGLRQAGQRRPRRHRQSRGLSLSAPTTPSGSSTGPAPGSAWAATPSRSARPSRTLSMPSASMTRSGSTMGAPGSAWAATPSKSAPVPTPSATRRSSPSAGTTPSSSTTSGPWVGLGGYAKQISATMDNTVYAIGGDNAVYENSGGVWVSLGGYVKQISASLDGFGNPEVFAIGLDDGLWVNHGGWTGLGGYVTEVSAPAVDVGFSGNLAYAVGLGTQGPPAQRGKLRVSRWGDDRITAESHHREPTRP